MAAIYFTFVNLNRPSTLTRSAEFTNIILFGGFAAIGALLAAYRPNHPIGWIFYSAGIAGVLSGVCGEYSRYTLLTNPGSLPAGYVIGFLGTMAWAWALFPMFTFLPLLFPTGRPPSPHWRWVGWLTLFGLLLIFASTSLVSTIAFGWEQSRFMIENPIGIPEADDLLGRISSGAFVLILISALLSAVSVFFRIRRADEQKRAQIKWFAFAVVINLGFIILSEITRLSDVIGVQLHGILFGLVVITLPVATAFAILKYRLWDIDIIIRRTLVYSVLTVSLGLLFFGGVTLLQHAFGALTGTESSPAAIVLSTLVIAALFNPLRRRIQGVIDRRSYRKKYNAEQALARFAAVARDETDVEQLCVELLTLVGETIQPEHTSSWLKKINKSVDASVNYANAPKFVRSQTVISSKETND